MKLNKILQLGLVVFCFVGANRSFAGLTQIESDYLELRKNDYLVTYGTFDDEKLNKKSKYFSVIYRNPSEIEVINKYIKIYGDHPKTKIFGFFVFLGDSKYNPNYHFVLLPASASYADVYMEACSLDPAQLGENISKRNAELPERLFSLKTDQGVKEILTPFFCPWHASPIRVEKVIRNGRILIWQHPDYQ